MTNVMQVFLIAALMVAIVAVAFAIQNAVPVTVNFLTWRFESSLALTLLIALAVGVLVSLLASLPSMIRRHRTISHLQGRIRDLEKDLQEDQGEDEETMFSPPEPSESAQD
jgi:uncharacterized integral membrane protein